jgi:cyanophycin synthetase
MFVVWILWQRFNAALKDNGGVILEVNAAPGFRMHLALKVCPKCRSSCNRYALSSGKSCRIPIIAVTGTNGKTTTTRLLAHIVKTMVTK